MKNFIIFYAGGVLMNILCGCVDSAPESLNKQYNDFDLGAFRKECLPFDSAKIENVAPYIMEEPEFKAIFNNFDSQITAPNQLYTCHIFSDSFVNVKYLLKGNSCFLSAKNKIIPVLIDFESTPVNICFPHITVGPNTPISVFIKKFPLSSKLYKGILGNAFAGSISINASEGNGAQYQWVFIFQSDHLAKVFFQIIPTTPFNDVPNFNKLD